MDFYFTNRQFELQEIISTNTSTAIVMAGEEDKLSIENGSRTLTGTLYFMNKQSAQVKVCAAIGNYILYHDKNNKDVWMTIVEIEHNPLNGTHTFVAEDAGLDLLNELVGPYKADKAYNIAYYINKFTFDSGFKIGFNEIPSLTRKLEWDSEDSTALARVLSVATQFDNAEIEFNFAVEGTNVLKKYINIYKKRGKDNRQTLYVNVDVNNIVVKSDIYDLGTSIYATGGTPDGKNSPINLKGYKYTDPKGRFVLGADGVMRDTESVQLWSRLLSVDNPNPKSSHIQRLKRYETTNKKTLCDSVVRELEKISKPLINYEVDITDLPEGVNIGDTVYLVDEHEEVYFSARVLELSFMYSTDSYVATLGDYLIKQGGVSQSLINLAADLKDRVNQKIYDVKLEATAQAFVDKKGTITIAAKVYDGTLDVSTNFSEYKWSRIDSEGVVDSDWFNITNTVTVSADDEPLWNYVCEVSNVLDGGTSYLIGSDRLTIVNLQNGAVGEPGKAGSDGKTSYFHTAYADDDQGTNFSTTDSNRLWMGTYSDFEPLDSSDYRKYSWSKIKGDDGTDGEPGKDGVGVKNTAITYAQSTSGTTAPTSGWTASVPTLIKGQYLWTKTVWTYTDATDETGYTVSYNAKDGNDGTNGIAGKDGVGISNTKVEYVGSTSGTTKPTNGWSTTIPTVPAGQYLWTRTTWQYTDGTSEQGFTNALMGRTGAKGDPGNQGIPGPPGPDGRTPYTHWAYAWSADGTDRFTTVYPRANFLVNTSFNNGLNNWTTGNNSWAIDTDVIRNGKPTVKGTFAGASTNNQSFMQKVSIAGLSENEDVVLSVWAKSDNPVGQLHLELFGSVYTSDINVGTEWTRISLKGKLKSIVAVFMWNAKAGTYWLSEPKLEKGTELTPYVPAPSDDYANAYPTYTGTYTDYTAADSTNPTDYTWVRTLGEAGQDGNDGIAGKDGVGIKSTAITYAASTSGTTAPTSGWTSTVPTVAAGSFLWAKTVWTYTDSTTETGYSVAKMGEKGTKGDPGTPGQDGAPGSPTGVTESATVPTSPYTGMLWKCTSSSISGYIKDGIYRWNGSKWELFIFTAVNITAESLSALSANLGNITSGNITGATIKGSSFINEYTAATTSGEDISGSTTIDKGYIQSRYKYSTAGDNGRYKGGPESTIIQRYENDGFITRSSVEDVESLLKTNITGSGTTWTKKENAIGIYSDFAALSYTASEKTGPWTRTSGVWLSPQSIAMESSFYGTPFTGLLAPDIYKMTTTGKTLWTGGWHMTANQTVTPTTKLSDCLNGWIIEFQGYDNGALTNGDFSYAYIPKIHATEHSGRAISAIICGHGGGIFRKILYVSNTQITGHANNNATPANTAVMSGVYAF